MPVLKTAELRTMPEAELHKRVAEMRKELAALRLKARQGVAEQPHRIRLMRRDIARMLTVMTEQKRVTGKR